MQNPHILLVEDEFLVRLILAESLVESGHSVVEAETGDEAVRIIDAGDKFSAIVTDIHMPGKLDGVAVGRRARDIEPGIPIIYVTGRPDAMNTLGHLGPLETLVRKPYRPSQVISELRDLLLLALRRAAGPGAS